MSIEKPSFESPEDDSANLEKTEEGSEEFSQAQQYLKKMFQELDEGYRNTETGNLYNCTKIANKVAEKIFAEGGEPQLLKIVSQDESYEKQMLEPKRYEGRVSWGDHTVCEVGGTIYDPIVGRPLEKEEYLNTVFTTRAEAKEWVSPERLKKEIKKRDY